MKSSILIHPEELTKKWIDRMADGGVDVLGLHPRGGKAAADTLAELVSSFDDEEFRALIDYAISRGLEVECEMHAARYLLPTSLFESHPEYFRMMANGERTADFNFCVSSEEAMSLVAQNAATLAKKLYRCRPVFYFWMDDAVNIHCKCPRCQEFSPSDQLLMAVNRMLTEIRRSIPDAKMAYLAYMDSLEVPTKVKPVDGVFLEYAPIEKYKKADPERIRIEREMLLKQAEFFGWRDSKVLEYWLDNSLFSKWKKPPVKCVLDKEGMKRDLSFYRAAGFKDMTSFGLYLGAEHTDLHGEFSIKEYADCFDEE